MLLLSVVWVVLHDYLLCVTWHRVVYYMVAGYRVHGPLLWGLSVGIMDCSIHWMAVESRESLLLLRFLQLMCLFAFCICFFCWNIAAFTFSQLMCIFPAKKRTLCLVSKSSWHFAEQCANPLFFIQRSQWTISSRSSYIPLQGISGPAQLQGQTVATMFVIYNTHTDNFRSYGSRKKACRFCRDKKFHFRKGTPMT